MSLRRLHPEQPESFAFTPANAQWASEQIGKYPEGRSASAVIPLLWRAQEQEGWVTRPAIEEVARMLGMAEIRVLEVATFYFMFQLQPVGSVAHIQICGTTSCMICGAEDLVAVCKEKIAPNPHQISPCGKFSWEEVECLGACSNAPMAQIGKDYFEDLTEESFSALIDRMANGDVPKAGPQNGRWASEPVTGLTSLHGETAHAGNASIDIADQLGDTIKRIDGTDPLPTWGTANASGGPAKAAPKTPKKKAKAPAEPKPDLSSDAIDRDGDGVIEGTNEGSRPEALDAPRAGKADDLKLIKGVGPKLEKLCNSLGFWHFEQIANWTSDEVAWVDANLQGFKGRVTRDDWVAQATILAAGGETEFSKRQ